MTYAKQSANTFNRDALEQIANGLESILRYYPKDEPHLEGFKKMYDGIQTVLLLQD